MPSHDTASQSLTSEAYIPADLTAALINQLPRSLSDEDRRFWVANQEQLKIALRRALKRNSPALPNLDMTTVYREILMATGATLYDWESMKGVDSVADERIWTLHVDPQLSYLTLFDAMAGRLGPSRFVVDESWRNRDFEDAREPADRGYSVSFRRVYDVSPQTGLVIRNCIVDSLGWRSNLITLREYLLMWFAYFLCTGKYIDGQPIYCLGTRIKRSDGYCVPVVKWNKRDYRGFGTLVIGLADKDDFRESITSRVVHDCSLW